MSLDIHAHLPAAAIEAAGAETDHSWIDRAVLVSATLLAVVLVSCLSVFLALV